MKGYKIIKNILQVIVLVACFAMQCNAQLPPPFDMPGKMFEIFTRNLAGEASQEEEKQNLYDGIRFARRQQCLEIPDVKDISERKTRIDQCDGIKIEVDNCDRRQAQANVSEGTIGKLKYGLNPQSQHPNDVTECLRPGSINDRRNLFNFYKRFRAFKNSPEDFKKETTNFAKQDNNGGIHFINTYYNDIASKIEFERGSYGEHPQTIYSSSYDNNYKKCNVGNLGYATHSNDSRSEDYTRDDAGFFVPSSQSEDFFDDLSNQTCYDFFMPHMNTYLSGIIMGETASIPGYSCMALAAMVKDVMAIKYGVKKLQKAKEIGKVKEYIQSKLNKAKSSAKGVAKMGINTLVTGAFYCYDGFSNGKIALKSIGNCTSLFGSSPPLFAWNPANVTCLGLTTSCSASAILSGAACATITINLINYYTQLAVKFSDANQTFQTNQMCGSEWLTWKFEKDIQQWKPDTETSYAGCLKNLFTSPNTFNDAECQKYGQFTNGRLIDNKNLQKFKFSSTAEKQNAGKSSIDNQYYREFWFRGIEYEDNDGGCKNPWDSARRKRYLGYDSEKQRYYVRGPVSEVADNKISIDYACHRFLRNVPGKENEENTAYQCCKRKAQNSICIEEKLTYREENPTVASIVEDTKKFLMPTFSRVNAIVASIVEKSRQDNYTKHAYKFCSLGDNSCQIEDLYKTQYTIFSSKNNPEYICAKTSNHCPYDHYLAGGTEKKFESFIAISKDGETPTTTATANFCQHLAHCSKTQNAVSRIPIPSNAYLSLACRNFIGDSLFKSSLLNGGKNSIDLSQSDIIVQKKSRNLTAPMVQCLKETLENYLLRKKAVICLDDTDYQTEEYKRYNICRSNPTVETSPDQLANQSVFLELRHKFQVSIRWALTLSVAIFGLLMLFAGNKASEMLDKKTLSVFVFKIGIVSYFALGNAWESFFMKTVFEAPLQFAELAFQPNIKQSENNVYQVKTIAPPRLSKNSDGCIFPPVDENGNPIIIANSGVKKIVARFSPGIFQIEGSVDYFKIENDILKKSSSTSGPYIYNPEYNILNYPANKKYLRIFDTFDCKIAHLLGYSTDVNVPNFLKMILVGFFSGGLGFAFMLASLFFAFFMILIALRVVHLIIVTIIVLSILVYISPLAFCCLMFKKTQHIFNQWLAQVMGYIVQPVIIFAYLGLFMTVLDNAMIGDAQFTDLNSSYDGNFKNLDCEDKQKNVFSTTDFSHPKDNSMLCAMAEAGLIENKSVKGVDKYSLQPFNLIVTSFKYNPTKPGESRERLKVMFKLALITFIFYKIFEYITSLAASLTGAEDSTSMLNALKQNIEGLAKKGASVVAGAEKIGRDMQVRGSKDFLSRGAKKGKEDASKKDDKNTGGTASSKTTGGGDGGGAA